TLEAGEALADFLNLGPAKYREAEPLARRTWEARARVLGPAHRDTLDSLDTYTTSLGAQRRLDEAILLTRECLAGRLETLGPDHPDTLTSTSNLAYVLQQKGEWPESIRLYRQLLAVPREKVVLTDWVTRTGNLAQALFCNGDIEEADRLIHSTLEQVT